MKTTLLRMSCATCIALTALIGVQAQNKKPVLSPPADTSQTVNGKTISIHYSAPSMRGRKIFGVVVPYGKVWRTGANPARLPNPLRESTDRRPVARRDAGGPARA